MGDYVENPASQVTRTLPCGAVGGPRPEKNLVAGGYKGQNKGLKRLETEIIVVTAYSGT